MTGLSSLFSSLIRGERDPLPPIAPDEYLTHCSTCGRSTIHVCIRVAGKLYWYCTAHTTAEGNAE